MSTQAPTSPNSMRRIAAAGLLGTTVEFYDFFIFGTAAALVFGSQFFPALGDGAATLASLATYAVAFVARPFGSILFGHYGDRIGRKATLVSTLLLMGGATVAIGLLPTAASIGVAAPLLLILCRILQGIAVGGEWAGAVLLTGEHAPPKQRGFYALFPQVGPALGLGLAMATFLVTNVTMTNEQFLDYGWRIPFLASLVLVVIGLVVRLQIEETPSFKNISDANSVAKSPLFEVVKVQPRQLLLGAGSLSMVFALFHTGATFLISYGGGTMALERTTVLTSGIIGAVTFAIFIAGAAIISDRIGRRAVTVTACALALPWSFLLFNVLDGGGATAFVIAVSVTLAIAGIGYGPVGAQLPELFQTRFRYTGAGVAYSLAGVLGGAIPPVVAEAAIPRWGTSFVGYYLAAYALLSLCCLLAMKETREVQMDDSAPKSEPVQV